MTLTQSWAKFSLAVLVVSLVWLVVLPRIARIAAVQERIERNERLGIDPSAMFYSDLEHLEYRDGMLRRMSD
jgi:uncharacterized membrane protein